MFLDPLYEQRTPCDEPYLDLLFFGRLLDLWCVFSCRVLFTWLDIVKRTFLTLKIKPSSVTTSRPFYVHQCALFFLWMYYSAADLGRLHVFHPPLSQIWVFLFVCFSCSLLLLAAFCVLQQHLPNSNAMFEIWWTIMSAVFKLSFLNSPLSWSKTSALHTHTHRCNWIMYC